jgi:hypothetical protein
MPTPGAALDPTIAPATPAPARVRRLTTSEIERSLADVFLAGAAFTSSLPRDVVRTGYANDFNRLGVDVDFADALQTTAEQLAAAAVARLSSLSTCDVAAAGESACAGQFVDAYGVRTYRRRLTTTERARLTSVYAQARTVADHPTAIGAVISAMVQSPAFLYRTELGAGTGRVVRLTPFETASALSYLLWGSTPDDALLQAASNDALTSADQIQQAAARLLADAKAQRGLGDFLTQWIGARYAEVLAPSAKLIPNASEGLPVAMLDEVRQFVGRAVGSSGEGTLSSLFTSTATFANADLATIYGITGGPKTTALEPVTLDGSVRSGFLTMPGFLGSHTTSYGFSPVALGKYVLAELFCSPPPPPPPDVPPAPEPGPSTTTRQRFAMHASTPQCRSCHDLMDPVGVAFERYDVAGRYRTKENGVDVTGAGKLSGTDVDGAFVGPVELGRKLATSTAARACFAAQAMSYALGRAVTNPTLRLPSDQEAIDATLAAVARGRGEIAGLLIATTLTGAFNHRDASGVGGSQQ